jgi:predicted RNA methylase
LRLAGQAKLGFYPIPTEVMALIAKHLKPSSKFPDRVHLLDPCCGKGAAVKQLSEALGVAEDHVYAVELDAERCEAARVLMPKANVQGPAGYLGVACTANSFGLAYLNPPFDDEIGGGQREEEAFVKQAALQVSPDGVLCLVMPWRQLKGKYGLIAAIDSNFDRIRIYRFPDEHRKFDEIVLFGVKRKAKLDHDSMDKFGCLRARFRLDDYHDAPQDTAFPVIGEVWDSPFHYEIDQSRSWGRRTLVRDAAETEIGVYELPWTHAPKRFVKWKMTEEELDEALRTSPLNRILKSTEEAPIDRPPLPPGKGHVSQLLASGMLDGVVADEHGLHVVRGTATKAKYLNAELSSVTENEKGDVTYKEVWSERIDLVVRCVDQNGKIWTFTSTPPEPPPEPEPPKEVVTATVRPNRAEAEAAHVLDRKAIADEAYEMIKSPNGYTSGDRNDQRRSYFVMCRVRGSDETLDTNERYGSLWDAEREAMRLNGLVLGRIYYYTVEPSDDEPNVRPADVFKRALALPSPA